MITRVIPESTLQDLPCSIVALRSAERYKKGDVSVTVKPNGYCTLSDFNKAARLGFNIAKRTDFKRGQRPNLSEYITNNPDENSFICVRGHFIFKEGGHYYSFFDNDQDEVVAVWRLKCE